MPSFAAKHDNDGLCKDVSGVALPFCHQAPEPRSRPVATAVGAGERGGYSGGAGAVGVGDAGRWGRDRISALPEEAAPVTSSDQAFDRFAKMIAREIVDQL
jgi:hypothetical protein